ncbi:efflux RND transporter periplasmic adaptor subunit [Gemmata sp. JC717]|uniref:efflux RND transporter periplasmic adaptor subunit n=1 Tax=Gemmata algarum TaxID=2975278 RepID=UPI0021BB04E1|nr:efflux RND transporter periplasmic adaptor subunit [Gemmata algarum]MDY3554296.1 efflux RND transporter periplasmic adaptor subunit [Gemmata algarum]
MPRIWLGTFLVAAVSALAGCRAQKPAPPAPPPPRVTVVRPATTPVRDYWVYNGYLNTTESVEVRSKIRGFLTEVLFKEGTEVAEDAPLYTIDKREYNTAVRKAEAELLKADAEIKTWEAQIEQSKADLERVSGLIKVASASKADLDLARATLGVRVAELKAAEANRDAAKEALHSANLILSYTDIKARIPGRIGRTHVHRGNLIQADTTLMATIVRVDKLYVEFDAPEADYFAAQKARIRAHPSGDVADIEIGVGDERDFPHRGTLDFRDNRVETATGTIHVRGTLDNPLLANNVRLLYPGMYARVRVPKSDYTQQTVIPEDCLLSGQEGRFLFVVAANNAVEKRIVTVGAPVWKAPPPEPGKAPPSWIAVNPTPAPPAEGQPPAPSRRPIKSVVAITAGLLPQDRVILDGLQQARPGAPVAPEEWNLIPPAEPKK